MKLNLIGNSNTINLTKLSYSAKNLQYTHKDVYDINLFITSYKHKFNA